jgi:hypothetical protein
MHFVTRPFLCVICTNCTEWRCLSGRLHSSSRLIDGVRRNSVSCMKMEAVCSSEMLVFSFKSTQRCNPEDLLGHINDNDTKFRLTLSIRRDRKYRCLHSVQFVLMTRKSGRVTKYKLTFNTMDSQTSFNMTQA